MTTSLINKFIKSGGDPFKKESILVKRKSLTYTPFLSSDYGMEQCGKENAEGGAYATDLAMDSIFLLKGIGRSDKGNNIAANYFIRFLQHHADNTCDDITIYNISPINILLNMNLINEAKQLRLFQKSINMDVTSYEKAAELQADYLENILSRDKLIIFYKNMNYEKLLEEDKVFDKRWTQRTNLAGGSTRYYTSKFNSNLYPYVTNKANLKIFRSLVDNGDICLASKKLFREIRGTEFESNAVLYMINNEGFMQSKNNCGDTDLDLLIN